MHLYISIDLLPKDRKQSHQRLVLVNESSLILSSQDSFSHPWYSLLDSLVTVSYCNWHLLWLGSLISVHYWAVRCPPLQQGHHYLHVFFLSFPVLPMVSLDYLAQLCFVEALTWACLVGSLLLDLLDCLHQSSSLKTLDLTLDSILHLKHPIYS